jgi:ADP-heptose:LPS heptosyltransferase
VPLDKILIIRNDKIGDFMLAWPAIALLKEQFPDAEITALVPRYTAPLAERCEWIDRVLIDDRRSSFISDVMGLIKKLRRDRYDASISLFSQSRTALALMLSGVKTRVGPATKIAQLFLNKKLRQKRSQSAKPEYEYNIDLVRYFIEVRAETPVRLPGPPYLRFDRNEITTLENDFRSEHSIDEGRSLVFIHPGTGGSAINLSLQQYADLARSLAERSDCYIVITAGPDELEIANELSAMIQDIDHCIHHSSGKLLDFCRLIDISDLFISGSTGPLHIAGALDRCTVAFYPSKRSATSLRWQTLNSAEKRLSFTNQDQDGGFRVDIDHVIEAITEKYDL